MNTKFSFFRLILFAVIFMQAAIIQAQEEYQMQINNIFEIPASKIPSGILLDRSPALLDMNGYNPANRPQIDTCSLYKWMCMYYRLYASHLNMENFQYDKTIAQQYLPITKSKMEKIPIGIIFNDYDKLKENAIQDGLLSVDTINMKVRDLSGASGTPTESATCFAFSPMADTISAGDCLFRIDPSLFVSNKTAALDELYIDFDDGRGYVEVSIGETVNVSYSLLGSKTLKAKTTWGRDSLTAYVSLYITQNVISRPPTSTDIPVPDFGPDDYDYNNIKAKYGIWYRCNHDNTIHKPILIVSGFDPDDKNRIGDEDKDKVYLYNVANKDRFLDGLRELGYDIIIYRSAHSTKSIIPNAMNLVNFMQEKIINVKTSDNELIVIGTSMGGLVCRYALTWMEHHNIPHKTKLFMSMDSPQNGANVPLGFQFMVKYLNQDFAGSIERLKQAMENMLDSDAAKEMLLYHHSNTTGLTARCATKRTDFLSSLSSIGNFPQKCRTMAVSLGSGNGTNQGFSAGASLIKKPQSPIVIGTYMTLDILLLMILNMPPTIGTTLAHSSWELEVHAVPNQTKGEIYSEELYLHVCVPRVEIIWTPLPVPIIVIDCSPHLIDRKIEVNNTQPLDNAPGSVTGLHNLSILDINGLDKIFSDLGIISVDSHFDCFIPAYSALGLSVAPHTNVKSYLNGCSGVTRINDHLYFNTNKSVSLFDYLYIENANLNHIYDDNKEGVFTPAMLAAMDDAVSSKNLYLENKTILSGQSVAYEASETITAGYSTDNISTNNGNFTVESGGKLDMKARQIVLKPGFHAKEGSTVHITADNSWVCPAGSIQSVSFSPLSSLDWEEVHEIETRPPTKTSEEQQTSPIIVQEIENEIRFFPNPVENILNLQILNRIEGEIRITVIDIKGQAVYSQSITNNASNVIDCSQFTDGVYFVKIAFKDSIRIIKIIKKQVWNIYF